METNKTTDEKISLLLTEAASAGDLAQVALCEQALAGDKVAARVCLAVIDYATAQENS